MNPHSSSQRALYVKRLATGLCMNGPVAADLPGWVRPGAVQGNGDGDHVPDIEARLGPMRCLIAVETADSLDAPEAPARWRTFARWAAAPGRMFLVAVPSNRERRARTLLEQLGIDRAEVITL